MDSWTVQHGGGVCGDGKGRVCKGNCSQLPMNYSVSELEFPGMGQNIPFLTPREIYKTGRGKKPYSR